MNGIGFLIGLAFGGLIAGAGFHQYDTIHNMLLLREPHGYLVMGSAVAVAAPLLWLLRRRQWRTPLGGALDLQRSPVARKHILGAMVFGAGWAISGTCPGPALAMTGSGRLLGLLVIAGLTIGLVLRDAYVARASEQETGRLEAGAAVSR